MAECVYPRFSAQLRQLLHERKMGARFCASLRAAGYSIKPSRCAAIVSGEDLPQDVRTLIVAISQCLQLTPSEAHELTRAVAEDLLADTFSPEWMSIILQSAPSEVLGER